MGAGDHRAQVQHLDPRQWLRPVIGAGRLRRGTLGPGVAVEGLGQVAHRAGGHRQPRGHIGHVDLPQLRMLQGDTGLGRRHGLAREPGLARADRRAGDAVGLEELQPLGARAGLEHRLEGLAGQQRVRGEGFPVVAEAQGLDGAVVEGHEQGRQEEPLAIPALIEPVAGRGPQRRAARQRRVGQHPNRTGHLGDAVQAADGHRLALSAVVALQQGGADGGGAHHRLAIVAKRQDQVDRLVGIGALPEGDAAQRGQQAVVGGQPAPGPGRSIGRHPGVDQPGIGLRERPGVQAEGLELAGVVVEQGDVGARDEGPRLRHPGLGSQVQSEQVLVAVPGQVTGMILHPVALRRLDLDDVGLEVPQQHGGHGPGQPLGEVDDAHAGECGHFRRPPWCGARRGARPRGARRRRAWGHQTIAKARNKSERSGS